MRQISYLYLAKFIWNRNKTIVIGGILLTIFIIFLISAAYRQQSALVTDTQELTVKIAKYEQDSKAASAVNADFLSSSDVLKRFLPDDFDIYTIINVIENITFRTKFTVESYSLSTQETKEGIQSDKKIVLTGSGTYQQFLDFIRQYKYITGQAVSIDSVSLNGKTTVISNLTLTLFAFKPKINLASIEIVAPMDKIDRDILGLVKRYTTIPKVVSITASYESKGNPFE